MVQRKKGKERMTRIDQSHSDGPQDRWRNIAALMLCIGAAGILYYNFDATPAEAESLEDSVALVALTQEPTINSQPRLLTAGLIRGDDDSQSSRLEGGDNQLPAAPGNLPLLIKLLLLEKGQHRLESIPDYRVTLFKQERVDGELKDPQVMEMKIRHEPFSVYMKWKVGETGRELIYVEGQNDGDMLVHPGGWKARLLPCVKLDPHGEMAMKESRQPITMAGMLNVVKKMAAQRRLELEKPGSASCVMLPNAVFNERDCFGFEVQYTSRTASERVRKSVVFIDKEYSLPVFIKNFGWPKNDAALSNSDSQKLDEQTLVEHYTFTDLHFDLQFADITFDRNNKDYKFKRR